MTLEIGPEGHDDEEQRAIQVEGEIASRDALSTISTSQFEPTWHEQDGAETGRGQGLLRIVQLPA